MSANFHETYRAEALTLPSDRSTGLVLAAALAVAAYLGRHHGVVLWPAAASSLILLAASLAAPARLRPLNIAWMKLAHLMSRIVSPIVMFVLFLVAIVPFGLIMQCVRDPLRRRSAKDQATYWVERGDMPGAGAPVQGSMRNQF